MSALPPKYALRATLRPSDNRLVGDRPGQCPVSDGFETEIVTTDRGIPLQTKESAIHTLGHVPTFATPLHHVSSATTSRH